MHQLDLIFRIASIVFPVIAIVCAGYIYSRRHKPDMSTCNKINMDLFTPALIFDIMSASDFSLASYAELAGAGLLVMIGSGLIAWPVAKIFQFQWKTFVPPMMFTNSGNMGVPLILLAFGKAALPAAIVLFALENFLHFSLGQQLLNHRTSILKILKNPMVIATMSGIGMSYFGISIHEIIRLPINMLGQISIPLMLFSLGARLIDIDIKDWKIAAVGSLVCPLSGLLVALLILPLFSLPVEQIPVLLLFSILPPAVLNYIVAEQYNQQPQLVASIVLTGNLTSLATIPVILWFIL
jgi:predicted permease